MRNLFTIFGGGGTGLKALHNLFGIANKSIGFTLAEVLVTLGIIGIVAALTIPALIGNHRKNVLEARLKKFYSTFNNAIQMSEQYNGESSTWNYSIQSVGTDESWEANNNFFDVYLFPYFLGIKRCEAGDKGCLNFTLDDSSDSYHTSASNFSRYIFSDGSCFGILTGGSGQSSANMHGWFDYNCNGKPNKSGKDQFYFSLRFSELPEKRLPFSFWNNLTPISNYNREYILQECKKNHESCAALIQYDNWNISDDYPVRL